MMEKPYSLGRLAVVAALSAGLAVPALADNAKEMKGMQQHDTDAARMKADRADMHAMAGKDGRDTDTWAEASITTSYSLNTQLNPFDISVTVKDGTAKLTGTVESDVEKNLAGEIARGADGVDEVDNQIRVDEKAARNDRENDGFFRSVADATTAAQIDSKLLWNSNTSGMDIDVDVDGRTAKLQGTVSSDAEKQLAESIALNTSGVNRVENELQVDSNKKSLAESAERTVSDAWITTKVKSTLAYSSNVSAFDINVDTENGKVTLTGEVDSRMQEREAIELARDVVGVKGVTDNLDIREPVEVSSGG